MRAAEKNDNDIWTLYKQTQNVRIKVKEAVRENPNDFDSLRAFVTEFERHRRLLWNELQRKKLAPEAAKEANEMAPLGTPEARCKSPPMQQ